MKTHRTIRYRLHPGSRAKARKLQGTAEACRFTWNHFVGKLKDDYRYSGRCDPRWYSLNKLFALWRKHQEKWLQDYSCAIVRLTLKQIETTYKNFNAGKAGLPRFKPQYGHAPSFPLGAGMFKLQGNFLHIQPSHRYLKARNLAARTQQKITQARTDWCHQVSREIADDYTLVYLEDLDTKDMTVSAKGDAANPGQHVKQKAGLNRAILDSGWHKLEQCLGYKASVAKVKPAYTSQICSRCGHTDEKNRKTRACHACVACGYRDHADHNAALSILAFGNGATGRGGGGITRPVKRQTGSEPPTDFAT